MVKYTNENIYDYNAVYSSDCGMSNVMPVTVVSYTYGETSGITNGATYFIKNKHSGQYLDAAGAGTTNNTNVLQWPYNGAMNQQWKAIYQGNGLYKFQAMHTTDKYLEVAYNSNYDGTNIDIFNGDYAEQYWSIQNSDNGSYRILSNCSNMTKGVSVENASMSNGANVYQYSHSVYGEDDWYFYNAEVEISSNDIYFLKNISSSFYADVYGNSLTDGAQIKQYSKTTQSNQLWRFERQESGYYKIYPMHTNDRVMSLDTNSSVVSIANATNDRTLWVLEKISGVTYKICSKQDLSKYITVTNNNSTTNLIGSTYNSTYSQWNIEEYDNNSYWDGGCISTGNPLNAYFTVTANAIDSNMTNEVYNDGEYWNVISSAVNMKYVSPGTSSNGRDLMVTFINDSSVSVAACFPIINGVQLTPSTLTAADLSDDWDRCTIYVNMTFMSTISDGQRQSIIIHELGHALKLSHNREIQESNNTVRQPNYKSTFPASMQPITSSVSGVNYLNAQDLIMSWSITNFDKSSIRCKWGN